MEIVINTKARVELVDITDRLRSLLKGTAQGRLFCYVPHTTAAITINEHADETVAEDIVTILTKTIPRDADYKHTEGNSQAHVLSSLIGNQTTILIENGELVLGTWQGVFFVELDGPRTRKIIVKIIQEGKNAM